jgi:hypothetical protein
VLDLANIQTTPPTPTPSIGSLIVAPSPATPNQSLTFTASGVTETGGTVSNVSFYLESNGTGGLQTGGDTLLGTATSANSSGNWTLTLSSGLAAGTYTIYAIATDSAGTTSNVVSASETVAVPQATAITASPSPATVGQTVTLTATGMTGAAKVAFYQETNGSSGLQTGSHGDRLLAYVTSPNSAGQWILNVTVQSAGSYTFYAAAVSSSGQLSNIVSTNETVKAAPTPSIGALTASPSTVGLNQVFTLSVANVLNATEVAFYQETNRRSGLQIGSDHLLGYGTYNAATGAWTLNVNSGTAAGAYTLYAVADNGVVYSNVASTTVAVVTTAVLPHFALSAGPFAGSNAPSPAWWYAFEGSFRNWWM